jgi:Fur family iron response transcriptional regulator
LLRRVGLRPTRQRLALGELLFSKGGRHVTAEMLHAEATSAAIRMSLATVYNTLNQFTDAGLLRQIGVDGSKSYFDTNPARHHHFFVDQEDRLFDVPEPGVLIDTLPQPLPGYEISAVDVVVHLRRKQA